MTKTTFTPYFLESANDPASLATRLPRARNPETPSDAPALRWTAQNLLDSGERTIFEGRINTITKIAGLCLQGYQAIAQASAGGDQNARQRIDNVIRHLTVATEAPPEKRQTAWLKLAEDDFFDRLLAMQDAINRNAGNAGKAAAFYTGTILSSPATVTIDSLDQCIGKIEEQEGTTLHHLSKEAFFQNPVYLQRCAEFIRLAEEMKEFVVSHAHMISPPVEAETLTSMDQHFNQFKLNLGKEKDHYAEKRSVVFGTGLDMFRQAKTMLGQSSYSLRRRIDTTVNLAEAMALCSGAVLSQIQQLLQDLKRSTSGIKGAAWLGKQNLLKEQALNIIKSRAKPYAVGNESHPVHWLYNQICGEWGLTTQQDPFAETTGKGLVTDDMISEYRVRSEAVIRGMQLAKKLAGDYLDIARNAIPVDGPKQGMIDGATADSAIKAIAVIQTAHLDIEYGPQNIDNILIEQEAGDAREIATSESLLAESMARDMVEQGLISLLDTIVLCTVKDPHDQNPVSINLLDSLCWKQHNGYLFQMTVTDLVQLSWKDMIAGIAASGLADAQADAALGGMLQYALDIFRQDDESFAGLRQWVDAGADEILKRALGYGVDAEGCTAWKWPALQFAVILDLPGIARNLHQNGFDISEVNGSGDSLLSLAIRYRRTDLALAVAGLYLERIDVRGSNGLTPLLEAVKTKDLGLFHAIAEKANLKVTDCWRQNVYTYAASFGTIAMIEWLEQRESAQFSRQRFYLDQYGREYTVFLFATMHGNRAIVETMLNESNVPYQFGSSQQNAFELAIQHDRRDLVHFFMQRALQQRILAQPAGVLTFDAYLKKLVAEPNGVPGMRSHLSKAVHLAAMLGRTQIMRQLLRLPGAGELEDTNGYTPLMTAANADRVEIVRLLYAHGARDGTRVTATTTALILAASRNHLRTIRFLLDHDDRDIRTADPRLAYLQQGAPLPQQADRQGHNAFTSAAINGNIRAMEMLFPYGTQRSHGQDEWLPVTGAASTNQVAAVRWLLEHGSSLTDTDLKGRTPFTVTVSNGFIELLRFLTESMRAELARKHPDQPEVASQALVNYFNDAVNGNYPLYAMAIQTGKLDMLKMLDESGLIRKEAAQNGMTPPMYAALHGQLAIFNYFAGRDFPVSGDTGSNGHSILSLAFSSGNVGIVTSLRQKLGDSESFNPEKPASRMLLQKAAEKNHQDMVAYLQETGVPIHDDKQDRHSILSCAIKQNTPVAFIEHLVSLGASLNWVPSVITPEFVPPLQAAIIHSNLPVIRYLLEQNAVFDGVLPGMSPFGTAVYSLSAYSDHMLQLLLKHLPPPKTTEKEENVAFLAARHGSVSKLALIHDQAAHLFLDQGHHEQSLIDVAVDRASSYTSNAADRHSILDFVLHCGIPWSVLPGENSLLASPVEKALSKILLQNYPHKESIARLLAHFSEHDMRGPAGIRLQEQAALSSWTNALTLLWDRGASAAALCKQHPDILDRALLTVESKVHAQREKTIITANLTRLIPHINVNLLSGKGETLILRAARIGLGPLAAALANRNMPVEKINLRDSSGRGALSYVVQTGSAQEVETLLQKGADLNARCEQDKSILMYAISGKRSKGNMQYLMTRDDVMAMLSLKTPQGLHLRADLLIYAIDQRKTAPFEILIKDYPSSAFVGNFGAEMLTHAMTRPWLPFWKRLREKKADPDMLGSRAATALMYALQFAPPMNTRDDLAAVYTETLDQLYKLADLRYDSLPGGVPIWVAAGKYDEFDLAFKIIENIQPSDAMNRRGDDGRSLLSYAAQYGRLNLVENMINAGGTPAMTDTHGKTVLMHAITGQMSSESLLKMMDMDGVKESLKQSDWSNNSALWHMVKRIADGNNIEVTDADGSDDGRDDTTYAEKVIERMLEEGCHPNQANIHAETPYSVAQNADQEWINDLLKKYGGVSIDSDSENDNGYDSDNDSDDEDQSKGKMVIR